MIGKPENSEGRIDLFKVMGYKSLIVVSDDSLFRYTQTNL